MGANHPTETLLRYLEGTLDDAERRDIDKHLSSCAECREHLSFVGGVRHSLSELKEEEFKTDEECSESSLLVAYEAGEVDEETARHLRVHLLFCDACATEYYALRRLSREASWQERLERLKEFVLDLGKVYGIGSLLGSFRIVAETPALAMRDGEVADKISKTVQVTVGKNTYGIELAVSPEGEVSCDIAGFHTLVKAPLSVAVLSEAGEELLSTRTDAFGNGRIVLTGGRGQPTDCLVLTLTSSDAEQQLLFRIGQR